MIRRLTPLPSDPAAVQQCVETDAPRLLVVAGAVRATGPAAPMAVAGEPTIVWVHDGRCEAIAPATAILCTVEEAIQWAALGAPRWLLQRRLDGVLVQYDTAAPAAVRKAARALREHLTPRSCAAMRELAIGWGHPGVIEAFDRIHATTAPTFADLARALSRSDDRDSARLARLCWALEHL